MTASILTVDDSPSLRMAIKIALTGAGYAVTEAGDGTSPADCPSEGLFSTDDYKPAPEYPR